MTHHEPNRLDAALAALREAEAGDVASDAVAQRLLAAVGTLEADRYDRRWFIALATAAALMASAIPVWHTYRGAGRGPATTDAGGAPTEIVTAFFPLAYGGVPATERRLVRLVVPRTALASFGLAPRDAAAAPASNTVVADVLVGEDGLARAVRFVRSGHLQ